MVGEVVLRDDIVETSRDEATVGLEELVKGIYGKNLGIDGYNVTYKPITLPCVSFMFIEIKFIYFHSCVMLVMKPMSICND